MMAGSNMLRDSQVIKEIVFEEGEETGSCVETCEQAESGSNRQSSRQQQVHR
jgi:hypothetical protein